MASFDPSTFNSTNFLGDLMNEPDADQRMALLANQLGVMIAHSALVQSQLLNTQNDLAQAHAQISALPPVSSMTTKASKKVDVFSDPGTFHGEINKFDEWWLKIQTWLRLNKDVVPEKSYDAVVAVLSRMGGQRGTTFSTTRLEQGTAYKWDQLVIDIEKQFRPTARPDWALEKLWNHKQTESIRAFDFADMFRKYFRESGISGSHAINILEQNILPEIRDQIIRNGDRETADVEAYLEHVTDVGEDRELMKFLRKRRSGHSAPSAFSGFHRYQSASKPQRDPNAMDIDALHHDYEPEEECEEIDAINRKPPRKRFNGCFNCGGTGHFGKECSKPSTRCKECNWSRGDHKKICSRYRQVKVADSDDKGKAKAT